MKKTIAILLILVIGMVGVFADDGDGGDAPAPANYNSTKTINLTANIEPVSALLITESQYNEYTLEKYEAALVDVADLDHEVKEKGALSDVGYLTIFSNLRSGYTIGYEATALTSGTEGTARYINYTVQIGADGTAETPNLTRITTEDATSKTATIITISTQSVVEVFSEPITIIISDDFDTAVAGDDYSGTIVFTYTAG